MRNRDMPASPVEAHEEVRWESDPPGGNLKSQRHDMKTGLTKFEATAIAIRAGFEGAPLDFVVPKENGVYMTPARYAVKEAKALWDEIEQIEAAE